jgi:hypothetical protein
MLFPEEFDINYYRIQNNDLINFDNNFLINHYLNYGIIEGRHCSIAQKREYLININNKFNKCLEIGPFNNPILVGNNVKYFDVLNKDKLIERAILHDRNNPYSTPNIDYVSENGDLSIITDKFDMILSAHLIEHQICLIKHLQNIENLLNADGYYILIIPDKRYCFDHYIKESTIADILNIYYEPRNNHTLKSLIEHRVLTCHNNPSEHWNNNYGEQKINTTNIKNAINEYFEFKDKYIDVHAWQFTPDSFRMNIQILIDLQYINLKIDKIYNTVKNSQEFIAILKK